MPIRAPFLRVPDAAKLLSTSLDALRELVVRREVATYALVRKWSVIWVPDRIEWLTNESEDDDEPDQHEAMAPDSADVDAPSDSLRLPEQPNVCPAKQTNEFGQTAAEPKPAQPKETRIQLVGWDCLDGRPAIEVANESSDRALLPLTSYTGRVRLEMNEAADLAAARNFSNITIGLDPAPKPRNWKGDGDLLGIAARGEREDSFGFCPYKLKFTDLSLAMTDVDALRNGASPQTPPERLASRVDNVSIAQKMRHTSAREHMFAAAFVVLAEFPNEVRRSPSGKVIVQSLASQINDRWPLIWRNEEVKQLAVETMEGHLAAMLRRLR